MPVIIKAAQETENELVRFIDSEGKHKVDNLCSILIQKELEIEQTPPFTPQQASCVSEKGLRDTIAENDVKISTLRNKMLLPHSCINSINVTALNAEQTIQLQQKAQQDIEHFSQLIPSILISQASVLAIRTQDDTLYAQLLALKTNQTPEVLAEIHNLKIETSQRILCDQQHEIAITLYIQAIEKYVLSLKKFINLTRSGLPTCVDSPDETRHSQSATTGYATNEQAIRAILNQESPHSQSINKISPTEHNQPLTSHIKPPIQPLKTASHSTHTNQPLSIHKKVTQQPHTINHHKSPKNQVTIAKTQLPKMQQQRGATQTTLTNTYIFCLLTVFVGSIYGIASGIPKKITAWLKTKLGKKTSIPLHNPLTHTRKTSHTMPQFSPPTNKT